MTPDKDFHDPESSTDFLAQIGVDLAVGLSRDDAMARRALYGPNRVTPPVNCPSWVCCLLPCLLRTPAMQAYQRVVPREATVRRAAPGGKSRKLRLDATSLVYGDVVELQAGDVVGADIRVLECSVDCVVDQHVLVGEAGDAHDDVESGGRVARRSKRVDSRPTDCKDPLVSRNVLLMATTVVQGSAVGVVVATGDHTVWGRMLSEHRWPVGSPSSVRRSGALDEQEEEDHAALVPKA
ncbi:hypothetical protein ATCC90586_001939 [Pythium insidiosum]|nr:hypothetical protein ATCC90586_001939 [Pythium insidiosum]